MALTEHEICDILHHERDRSLAYDVDKSDIVENAVLSYPDKIENEDHLKELIEFASKYFDKFQRRMEYGLIWDLKKAPK